MYYSENGDEIKKFNTRDGVALRLLQNAGVKVGIITAEERELNRRRGKKLNLDFQYHGVSDKAAILNEICKNFNVTPSQVGFVGDEINDLALLRAVGFSFCPSDANPVVTSSVLYRCKTSGGHGVIREIFELFSRFKG
jgi:N-acylneuraminate cytidylyltransferase